jgi:hypothetical protein
MSIEREKVEVNKHTREREERELEPKTEKNGSDPQRARKA